MTELPNTAGRRVWALAWRLALPWVVCGGLLWALVGMTPRPAIYCPDGASLALSPQTGRETGLEAAFDHPGTAFVPAPGPPVVPPLLLSWNVAPLRESLTPKPPSQFLPEMERLRDRLRDPLAPRRRAVPARRPEPAKTFTGGGGPVTLGAFWRTGGDPGNRYLLATVSPVWLLPLPLVWTAFNLWRWFRPGRQG
ncbi:hypothetical protein [Alienimonas sp. DA493]|uniref:hypothetical protein n=1 Tax=Alienimonas sp. DA493 TaxID=3373605 RepID=UPI003753FD14